MSADERRVQVISAALTEFARRGLEGTTTEAIARRVGVSQPYLFRLFPNKKALFIAACEYGTERTVRAMTLAAEGLTGHDALKAMGDAYLELIDSDRDVLLMQLQQYAACHDEEVRRAVTVSLGRLWAEVERITGVPATDRAEFIAHGMLCNVVTAVGVEFGQVDARWRSLLDALNKDAFKQDHDDAPRHAAADTVD
jgi:AcrR family transcriptional regulator